MRSGPIAVLVSAVFAITTAATAQDAPAGECSDAPELDEYQLLRRLSLDLRGRVPTHEEYSALDAEAGVPAELVASWVKTDAFAKVMRRYLKLRFHGVKVAADDVQTLAPLRTLFDTVVTKAQGTSAQPTAAHVQTGWHAVCVALVTDPEFHIY